MIVDDLAASSPWIREFCRGAHIVRVPFPIAPMDGDSIVVNRNRIPQGIIRSRGREQSWIAEAGRLPFHREIIVSMDREYGALFVRDLSGDPECVEYFPPNRELSAPISPMFVLQVVRRDSYAGTWGTIIGLVGDLVVHSSRDNGVDLLATTPVADWSQDEEKFAREYLGWQGKMTRDIWRNEYESPYQIDASCNVLADYAREWAWRNRLMAEAVIITNSLLNCRNVVQEEVAPPAAVQRARARRGKPPLYQYHILKVRPFAPKKLRSATRPMIGPPVAIHTVRGHFKRYTPDRPLFGRLTGVWWWQPQLAGRAKRLVEKDYEIRA